MTPPVAGASSKQAPRRGPTSMGGRTAVSGPGNASRTLLLREIRLRAPVSRIELSKWTGISKPAVTRAVAGLIDEGLVVETGPGSAGTRGGRRPRMLELLPSAAAGLGCMVKVGQIVGSIAGFNGAVEHRKTVSFDPISEPKAVVEEIVELLDGLIAKNQPDRPVMGLGMSFPGLIDEIGRVLAAPHMPGWRDLDLAHLLEAELDMPVYLDNESRVQAVAEAWSGQARGINNFVCLEAGVGISAGIVINGELWRGTHSLAGETGHTSMTGNGDRCYCDGRGCWEMSASTTHLLNSVKTASIARGDQALYEDADLTMERLVEAANSGDSVALREIELHADALSSGICNLILAYDPERIILHGESTLLGERLVEMIRRRVAERFRLWLDYDAPIVVTELGTEGAQEGVVNLALHAAWGFGDPTAEMGGSLPV
jgi:predicted NBD/HSP70 family sugar kinase